MKPRHKVSRDGIELIKSFEGYRRTAARLDDGRWTIGYGHTKTARQGVQIPETDADLLLRYDLVEVAAAVNALTFTPLTQNQFDALVSFAFNIGVRDFRRSLVLRRVNEGALLQAACALELWRKADFEGERIVVDALVRRRAAEKALFLTPTDGWVAAPSPVLEPRLDAESRSELPVGEPIDLKASLEGEAATLVREDAGTTPIELDAESHDHAPHLDAAAAEVAAAASEPASQITEASKALTARLEAIFTGEDIKEPVKAQEADGVLSAAKVAPEPEAETSELRETVEEMPAKTHPEITEADPEITEPEKVDEQAEPTASDRALHAPIFESLKRDFAWPESELIGDADTAFRSFRPVPAAVDLMQQPIYREQSLRDGPSFETAPKPLAHLAVTPYLVLAFFGLVIFALATSWSFHAGKHTAGVHPMTVGVPLAIVGAGCVAWAVYVLTTRFNGRED